MLLFTGTTTTTTCVYHNSPYRKAQNMYLDKCPTVICLLLITCFWKTRGLKRGSISSSYYHHHHHHYYYYYYYYLIGSGGWD